MVSECRTIRAPMHTDGIRMRMAAYAQRSVDRFCIRFNSNQCPPHVVRQVAKALQQSRFIHTKYMLNVSNER